MGLHNRSYWKEDGGTENPMRAGGLFFGLPPLSRVVRVLLIVNVAMFLLQWVADAPRAGEPFGTMSTYLGATGAQWWQPWRYITFQFLHAGFWHIVMNMLGLYLLGSPLEQHWGPKRFLTFYLGCGAFAGAVYAAMSNLMGSPDVPLVGASGGIFAILLACAVLFPEFKLILFIFPVPIRLAALLIFGFMIFVVLGNLSSGGRGGNFWSDTAHLGGAVAAAIWLWVAPRLMAEWRRSSGRHHAKKNGGAWRKKLQKQVEEQAEIDRILQKIHNEGLASLTHKEKKHLQDATRKQQEQERESFR